MSIITSDRDVEPMLANAFLAHLDAQLESAHRMLATVLEQGAAIRRRDVQNVVRLAGALQVEMHRREVIETERLLLLGRAARVLELDPDGVTLTAIQSIMDPASAQVVRARTSELAGLLMEIQREHETNRLLMQQELAFLDYLLQLAGSAGSGAYDGALERTPRRPHRDYARSRVFDLEA
jgi:hypothetical protein